MTSTTPNLFSYRKFWAHRFGTAPVLPVSREEMDQLGWDSCDIILVTGDAYVDHPSFGMALIGRLLEAHGFRVGIIAQPNWQDTKDFQQLGRPNLFLGITAGNMDSMVNRYTADRRIRSDDAYSPNGAAGLRPDRSVIVYSQRAKEAYKGIPVIIGGIEASLRRIAHYDYWSDKVRRSILPDSKADMLIFGNGDRAIVEVSHRLAKGEPISAIQDIRGTCVMCSGVPDDWQEIDHTKPESPVPIVKLTNPYAATPDCTKAAGLEQTTIVQPQKQPSTVLRLPSYDQVASDQIMFAHAARIAHLETNPGNAHALIQRHGKRDLWINPPPVPLSTPELDQIFDLPYTRKPHPSYHDVRIPAWEMIRFSINIMRGCFGGCTFCSITEHEGRIVQNRSEDSIIKEIEDIRDKTPGFTGNISDLGGPTANMYRLRCKNLAIEAICRKPSCIYPKICKTLDTDHGPLTKLYRRARKVPGIKRVFIASGLRYDLAIREPEYLQELVTHHVGGYLKIAPEHTEEKPLQAMMKPGIDIYDKFKREFDRHSKAAGKEQYLIPYFMSAHPGSTNKDMLEAALWLKKNGFRLDQVQAFLPTPMAIAADMYHTGLNTLKAIRKDSEIIPVAKGLRQRRLQKAFLRYHDPKNWPLLRDALNSMGRADLIGNGKRHLVPAWQPQGRKTTGSPKETRQSQPRRKVAAKQRHAPKRRR
ncbi:UPF0313 [4Fe-4S] protein YgiQ [hydrothermal vent metagenome]|uniref:UPF0313 [4Fe-4S] protein YgiQ n=1 Tax=hydrothermal vent metagenome TaxID=652676 RepID=A0A3B1BWU1_9ZZZZ